MSRAARIKQATSASHKWRAQYKCKAKLQGMKFASIASAKTKTILLEILLLLVFIVSSSCERELGVCREGMSATTLGGIHSSHGAENSIEIDSLARFAVDEHNKKQNTLLEFAKVVKAEKQVVAGVVHHLTVEAVDAGKKKVYEAKVWVKPWTDFKELQEFKHAGDATLFTSSDLGVRKDGHGTGLQEVCTNDPQVEVAAKHAVNIMQQRSNSLVPYELGHVISSKAEVAEESTEFHLVLKVKRGSKEEEFEVVVHKNNEGSFHLKDMKQKLP